MIRFDPAPGAGGRTLRRRSRALLLCLLGVPLLATASCRRSDPPPAGGPAVDAGGALVFDLIAELPAATLNAESALIDVGSPSARPHLIAGWSADEQDTDGTFAWGVGKTSTLSFFAVAATDVTLHLLCKPLVFEGAPEQTVSVALNGRQLGEISLSRKLERYQIEIPAGAIASGANRLELHFGYSRQPSEVIAGAADERDLAVRFSEIELEGLGALAPPGVAGPAEIAGPAEASENRTEDRIELPAGTAVRYYFDHAASTELVIDSLETWGPRAGDVRLLVRSRSADTSDEVTRLVDPGAAGGPLRIPLATAGPAVDRLELAAVSDRRGRRVEWLRRKLGRQPRASGLSLVLASVRDPGQVARRPQHEPPRAGAERPNVIIYLIDTLRADHLGVYGYDRPTSPNIDRFAADSVLFANARAQSSWTRPSVVSLLTGLQPRSHGVNRREDAVSESVETIAELLARRGYETAGFVTNGNAGPNFGLDQGFSHYRYLRESADISSRHRLSDHLNLWIFHWLENRAPDAGPFFLYAHTTDPHAPYTPAEPFRRRFAPDVDPQIGLLDNVRAIISGSRETTEHTRKDLADLYDAEIAFNDHHFGQLIERLKERGFYESSLIILVADHGEEFLDHDGWEHGVTLFDEQLHVPLIVKFPNEGLPRGVNAGMRVDATVGQVDVMPTILDLLGLVAPALDGVSLLDAPDRASFAHLSMQDREMRSVTRRGWKLIIDDSPFPRHLPLQLFSLKADRRETVELAGERPFERELLSQLMRRWELDLAQRARSLGEQAEIPDELRRQLEALGYL